MFVINDCKTGKCKKTKSKVQGAKALDIQFTRRPVGNVGC